MAEEETILITGAAGLLGRHLVAAFAPTHEVHALVHSMPTDTARVAAVHYHACDFGGVWSSDGLPKHINTVMHLAQSSNFRDFPGAAMDVFRVNIASTAQLLDYAHKAGAERFIYASSGGVYASRAAALDEDAPIKQAGQLGYYLSSKRCGEILVENYAALMHVQIMRIFFMYGSGQKRSMLLPRLYDNVRDGRAITLQGDEGLTINPVHVEDVVKATQGLMQANENILCNVAGPTSYSLKAIGELMGNHCGRAPAFAHTDGVAEDLVTKIDVLKNHNIAPTRLLEDALADIA